MNRAVGAVSGVLVVCLLLPVLAPYATRAVPLLISLLLFLAIARLAWPSRRR